MGGELGNQQALEHDGVWVAAKGSQLFELFIDIADLIGGLHPNGFDVEGIEHLFVPFASTVQGSEVLFDGEPLGGAQGGHGPEAVHLDLLVEVGHAAHQAALAIAPRVILVGLGDAIDHRQHQGLVGVAVGEVEHGGALLELDLEVVLEPVGVAQPIYVFTGSLPAGFDEVEHRLEHRGALEDLHLGFEAVLAATAGADQGGQGRVLGQQLGGSSSLFLFGIGQHDLEFPFPHGLLQQGDHSGEQQGAAGHLGDQAPAAPQGGGELAEVDLVVGWSRLGQGGAHQRNRLYTEYTPTKGPVSSFITLMLAERAESCTRMMSPAIRIGLAAESLAALGL